MPPQTQKRLFGSKITWNMHIDYHELNADFSLKQCKNAIFNSPDQLQIVLHADPEVIQSI